VLAKEFDDLLHGVFQRVEAILGVKANEYAADADRLHNFKVAADLKGESPRQALAGMLAKHTVSVYDMAMSDNYFTIKQWDEKIIDHINYLILLLAIVQEEMDVLDDE
jgi:hypothetical protein